jgi:hypothetical protein
MCPRPGTTLSKTAIASLALGSAVSVARRVQSHRLQLSASFGNSVPQYGHGIMSVLTGCG